METSKLRLKPLTIVISIGLLIFSALSWFNFLRSDIYQDLKQMPKNGTSEIINNTITNVDNNFTDMVFKKIALSRIDAKLTYLSTKEISSSQVVKGKNGWMFYFPNNDGNPVDIYEGKAMLNEEELYEIGNSAKAVQDYLDDKGIEFVLMLAPNKESVYFEYVPDEYIRAEYNQTDQIAKALADNDVCSIYLKDLLLENKDNGYPIYYQTDTHWNKIGGYLGAKGTLESFGINLPELSELTVSSKERAGGDLVNMVGLGNYIDYEYDYYIEEMPTIDVRVGDDLVHLTNENAVENKKIFVIGDSFRKGLLEGLLYEFSDVYVVHRDNYEKGTLKDIGPDIVIAVYVERYATRINELAQLLVGE